MQKAADSLNANYSFKYFGKEQGVAAYTFRDERDLLFILQVIDDPALGQAIEKQMDRMAPQLEYAAVEVPEREGLTERCKYAIREIGLESHLVQLHT